MKVRWWPHTDDRRVASFRLRCLQVIEQLRAQGLDAALYERNKTDAPDVLVLLKRYDADSLTHALQLRRSGTTVLLDLCDNHFHVADATPALLARAESLRQAVRAVDVVVAASDALAQVIRAECPEQSQVVVIADAAELPYDPPWFERLANLRAEIDLRRFRQALEGNSVAPHRRLVWFGNHGSPGVDGGMSDLARIRSVLEKAAEKRPLSLSVISNHRQKFEQHLGEWHIPTHYLEWQPGTFSRALRLQSAAVIPVGLNPFTRCKTNNRLASAFLHGLNVLADGIPSYTEFADCALLDNWDADLDAYLEAASERAADVKAGVAILTDRYSLPTVAAGWRGLFQALAGARTSQGTEA